jgi:hypothetical protein
VQRKINWIGLVGGITTIILIIVSVFIPWWQFRLGNPVLVEANVSPLNTNFSGLGSSFTLPLLWAFNLASILSLAVGGICMLIYSVFPDKSYSMRLLGFSYRKPLYAVLLFFISLVALVVVVNSVLGFSVPLAGTTNLKFPASLTQGASVTMFASAEFIWPFYLGIIVAALCIVARVYHKKVVTATTPTVATSAVVDPSVAPVSTAT